MSSPAYRPDDRAYRFGYGSRLAQAILFGSTCVLFAGTIAQWILIRWLGDYWWPGTVAMFAPRWPLLVPLAVVSAMCLVWQRRLLWVSLASAVVLLGPVMGFCVPNVFSRSHDDGVRLRVMTANLGGGVDIYVLRARLRFANPDIIAFQETPSRMLEVLGEKGWNWQSSRGLAVGSRFPILRTEHFEGSRVGRYHDNGLRIQLETPAGKVWVCCIYLDSPRGGFEALMVTRRGVFGIDELRHNLDHRSELSKLVSQWVDEVDGPKIVAGDMNQPPESHFRRRDWSNWQDAFAQAGLGYGHTWFSSWHGVRIDHILYDAHWVAESCHVAGPTGGDHRPVVAELELAKQPR